VSWLFSIKSKHHEIVLVLGFVLAFQDVNLLIIFCFLFFEIVGCYCFLTMSMTMSPHIWHFRYNTNSIVFKCTASLPPSFCTEFLRTGWLTQHSLRLNFKTLLFKTTMSNHIQLLDNALKSAYDHDIDWTLFPSAMQLVSQSFIWTFYSRRLLYINASFQKSSYPKLITIYTFAYMLCTHWLHHWLTLLKTLSHYCKSY
jgi:hypothetical protein